MDQIIVLATLLLSLGLFAWGRIRHDLVALLALFAIVVTGIVEPAKAFSGFGHPAMITVAAVLVISKALELSGLVDLLGKWVSKTGSSLVFQVFALSSLVALASSFMNNVGALAIVMPVAIHLARKGGYSPSYTLMPLAFASLLGGMTTLIGTPTNIIIASYRGGETGQPFGMFHFTPVGVPLTLLGLAFIALVGWRLMPKRSAPKADADLFGIADYITEVMVIEGSLAEGKTVQEFTALAGVSMQILGLVRNNVRIHAPDQRLIFEAGDELIIETDADELKAMVENTGVRLIGEMASIEEAMGSTDFAISEAVVMADSLLVGRSLAEIQLRRRYRVNLLAVARRESRIHRRLMDVVFQNGDVLLLHGRERALPNTITALGCLPLAPRGLTLDYPKRIPLAFAIFGLAIAIVVSGLLPAEAAFSMAAVAMVLTGVLPLKELYRSIDWPVIVLLGAMIPVGISLETTGGAERIAQAVMLLGRNEPAWVLLGAIMVVTILLTSLVNNAATALIMAPIAIGVAKGLGYSIDPFLMAVAIGSSSAFLTPIGHQSNTLVMASGGYRFTDFTRMGLPVTLLILLVGVPLILWVFPV